MSRAPAYLYFLIHQGAAKCASLRDAPGVTSLNLIMLLMAMLRASQTS